MNVDLTRYAEATRRINHAHGLAATIEAILAAMVGMYEASACALMAEGSVFPGPGFEGISVVPQPGVDPGPTLEALCRERGIHALQRWPLSLDSSPLATVLMGWSEPPAELPLKDCLLDAAAAALHHARTRQDMENLVAQLFALHSASEALSDVVDFATTALLGLTEAERIAIFLLEKNQLVLKSVRGLAFSPLRYALHHGPFARVAALQTLLTSADLGPEDQHGLPEGFRSALQLPLVMENRLLGVALLEGGKALDASKTMLLRTVAAHVASALKNAMLYEMANRQAITDGLTELYNHRYFQDALHHLVNSHRRYKRPFSLLMVDVDGFKAINDTHGHLVGDEILKQLAETLKKTLRVTDIIARYGGDEISILLPETTLEKGRLVAERLVRKIHQLSFPVPDPVTVSIGLSACPEYGDRAEDLIMAADRGLYQAKNAGKNRVGLMQTGTRDPGPGIRDQG